MKTNTLLTYILYALITGLVAVVVYKAIKMKQDEAQMAKQSAEFQKSLRDHGYLETDSTGSQYAGEESGVSSGANASTVTDDGIEYEAPTTTATPPAQNKQPAKSTESTPAPPKAETQTQAAAPAEKKQAIRDLDTDNSDGRYRVIAGSFRIVDGARREMERIIKMGYHDAEIGYTNRHTYAVVVVKRTNSLSEAKRIVAELERKGVDARVMERSSGR